MGNRAPYRAATSRPTRDGYAAAWDEYRRNRRSSWIVFFGWPLVGLLIAELIHLTSGDSMNHIGPYVEIPVGLVALVLFHGFGSSMKCPRCGEHPHVLKTQWSGVSYRNPMSGRCLNCGIRIGAPESEPSGRTAR